jgi:pimeloyl-ACP methyl ester carboxylesterase
MSPAAIAPRIADLLGRATFVEWSDLGHFGPLEDPARFAKLIAEVAAGVGD